MKAYRHSLEKGDAPELYRRTSHRDAVYPITVSIALRDGQLDGENQARGIRIPFSDLLIGVTALELDYSVGTSPLTTVH